MQIVFYVSGHGFGHASRDVELIRAMCALRADARIVVRTAAPERLFGPIAGAQVDVQPLEADTGLVQIDSLQIDEEESARQAARFHADFDRRVAEEAELLDRVQADVVVGDTPPLAFASAARAGVPSVAVGNFTWDWIYSVYPAFDRLAPGVIPAIRHAYASATLALRLPLHGGFEPMAAVTRDIPFIARRSTRDAGDTRRALGLTGDRPAVLPSFGAYGADLPLALLWRPIRRRDGSTRTSSPPPTSSSASRGTASCPSASRTTRRSCIPRAAGSSNTTSLSRKCRTSCGAGTFRSKICSPAGGRMRSRPSSPSPRPPNGRASTAHASPQKPSSIW